MGKLKVVPAEESTNKATITDISVTKAQIVSGLDSLKEYSDENKKEIIQKMNDSTFFITDKLTDSYKSALAEMRFELNNTNNNVDQHMVYILHKIEDIIKYSYDTHMSIEELRKTIFRGFVVTNLFLLGLIVLILVNNL